MRNQPLDRLHRREDGDLHDREPGGNARGCAEPRRRDPGSPAEQQRADARQGDHERELHRGGEVGVPGASEELFPRDGVRDGD